MTRLTQVALVGVAVLVGASIAAAQQGLQPVVRLGNFIEVSNDVFMHILAAADIRYQTVENRDFDSNVRDRAHAREPGSAPTRESEGDIAQAELRFGAEFRYQKNLTLYLLFEHQQIFDGNLIDDRSNSTNPGGTDVFGRPAVTENPGFHTERYWIDYKFPGTPLRMRVGADLWNVDQAGTVGDDDPRFALFGEFGAIDVMAAAVIQFESQRLGLENDNDSIYYTFSAGYNFKPHRVQLDVIYFRDRFSGADMAPVAGGNRATADVGFQGQKHDSVVIGASWSGRFGPVRALVQGNINVGTAKGGYLNLPAGVAPGRDYDIFAAAAIAYAEADLGRVRPFVGVVYGTGDGDATDRKLHGYAVAPFRTNSQIFGTGWFNHLETSTAFGARDAACPARVGATPLQTGLTRSPLNVGTAALGSTTGGVECAHSESFPFNNRLGNTSHLGIETALSNPGALVVPVGVRVFPFKGHEITGWYVYRGMVNTTLLEVAFAPDLAAVGRQTIRKTQYHGLGGFYQWTINPYFDIRLAGEVLLPGEGYKDIAQVANCNFAPGGAFQSCDGNDPALRGEVRFRARF